jgi:hypothetical protein
MALSVLFLVAGLAPFISALPFRAVPTRDKAARIFPMI